MFQSNHSFLSWDGFGGRGTGMSWVLSPQCWEERGRLCSRSLMMTYPGSCEMWSRRMGSTWGGPLVCVLKGGGHQWLKSGKSSHSCFDSKGERKKKSWWGAGRGLVLFPQPPGLKSKARSLLQTLSHGSQRCGSLRPTAPPKTCDPLMQVQFLFFQEKKNLFYLHGHHFPSGKVISGV